MKKGERKETKKTKGKRKKTQEIKYAIKERMKKSGRQTSGK